ncbi:hypothetical protein A3751_11755 [Oleiphilus sp. HI0080]|uniref:DUF6160 family protein n=1 Tax=Oleiphilus sp. HI0080 TaxID=1822255 RepID=UPI0007C3E027|nr:DUF6160 family protein [Oleiphilus sp. HI0080]KZZ17408.1 hypothetical protein A3751_11755 [Oleiphilus sp. HI0080]
MKGLKKIALASAIAAVSAGAQAELKALDDSAMGELTGQAGLTIDLETKYTIGEFMYKDAGSVFLSGISLGANTNETPASAAAAAGYVDNIRIKLDIAGAGAIDPANGVADNSLDTGFSRVRDLAGIQAIAAAAAGNADAAKFGQANAGSADLADLQAAGIVDNTRGVTDANAAVQTIAGKQGYGDGDLLIHVSFKDAWQKAAPGGLAVLMSTDSAGPNAGSASALGDLTYAGVLASGLKSVDFNFSIDAIGLADSTFAAGDSIGDSFTGHTANGIDPDGDAGTTVLISDLSINGYLGPVDIHIENNGNGFGSGTATPTIGAADSKINWNTYVNVTDLDVYLDIAGVQITDLKINNVRGDVTDLDGNFSFGFAQSNRQIFAVRNTAGFDAAGLAAAAGGAAYANPVAMANDLGLDGVAINTTFKGDMEIGALSFGDTGTSIGELYWTDIESYTNWTISAH